MIYNDIQCYVFTSIIKFLLILFKIYLYSFRLPVTKISITRGPKSNTYYESTESGLIQTSPASMAEDVSTSPSQDIDTRLKTLQIQSRP